MIRSIRNAFEKEGFFAWMVVLGFLTFASIYAIYKIIKTLTETTVIIG